MGQHQEEQLCQILLGNRWHRDSQDCPQLVFFFHSLEPPGTAGRLGRVSQRVQSAGEDLAALAWEVLEGRTGHPHCHRPLPTEQGVGAPVYNLFCNADLKFGDPLWDALPFRVFH